MAAAARGLRVSDLLAGVPVTIDDAPFKASYARLDLRKEPGTLVLDAVNLSHLLYTEVAWTVDADGVVWSGRGIVIDITARMNEPIGSVLLVEGPVERRRSVVPEG